MQRTCTSSKRRGSVYLAVLGTAMIAGVLAFSALALQRVQNRNLAASSDVRQAQLNAEGAVQLGLLTMKSSSTWRTSNPHGDWFADRDLGAGTATLSVVDPIDGSLTNSPTEPVVMTGIGTAGRAVQRVTRTIDSYPQALSCLRSSLAAGGDISLSGCTLRASNSGLITANAISASGSNVFGRVQAITVTGGTYRETTTQVTAADRPKMPDWTTVFDYYRNNATEISLTFVDSSKGSLGRNGTFSVDASYWTGSPPGAASSSTVNRSTAFGYYRNGPAGLRITGRGAGSAGAAQLIDSFVTPGQSLQISAYVSHNLFNLVRNFRIRVTSKGTLSSETTNSSGDLPVLGMLAALGSASFVPISATVAVPSWSGELEYAYVSIGGDSSNTADFNLDDVTIQDVSTGKFIFRDVLGPGVNTIGGGTNAQGLYWINCANNRIVIERSRIKGTLLLMNPGAGSMIAPAPIHWSPSIPGYPILLVDAATPTNANFTIAAINRPLSEMDDGTNYNPAGMSYETLGTDSDTNDTYPAEIQGLILVRNNLTFQNNSLVKGSIVVGNQVISTSASLDVNYRPDALYSPPPGLSDTPKNVPRPLSVRKIVGP